MLFPDDIIRDMIKFKEEIIFKIERLNETLQSKILRNSKIRRKYMESNSNKNVARYEHATHMVNCSSRWKNAGFASDTNS